MKKKRLDIDYSYDFELIGIISPLKGYKLAWEINNRLEVKLIKDIDLQISFKKGTESSFSYFSYHVEGNVLKLFRNKPNEQELTKNILVPEYPHFDFILMTQSDDTGKSNRLQEVLRTIPSIELVAFIPLIALKSKDHFIF
ncbi:MAG: IPExxxVDY family protein [Cyclobacteriaceae bacterium]|nr:IPExxxVDY family protein [Cyclobacteriaceae bacterium]